MAEPNGSQEIKNAAGETVGHFLPEPAYQKLLEEQERLRRENAEYRAVVAKFIPADFFANLPPGGEVINPEKTAATLLMLGLKPEDVIPTEEEIRDIEKNGVPFADIVEQIIRESDAE